MDNKIALHDWFHSVRSGGGRDDYEKNKTPHFLWRDVLFASMTVYHFGRSGGNADYKLRMNNVK
jgi:hypothetical protein